MTAESDNAPAAERARQEARDRSSADTELRRREVALGVTRAWWTYDQAAELFAVSRKTIERRVADDELRAVTVGKRLRRIPRASIVAYIARIGGL